MSKKEPSSASLGSVPEASTSKSGEEHFDQRRQSWVNNRVPDLSFLSNNFSSDSIDTTNGGQINLAFDSPSPSVNRAGRFSASDIYGSSPTTPKFNQRDQSSRPFEPQRPKSMYIPATSSSEGLNFGDATKRTQNAASKRNSYYSQTPQLSNWASDARMARSRSNSPTRSKSPRRSSQSPVRSFGTRGGSPTRAPFNFKPQDMTMMHSNGSNSSLLQKPAHRKGHRYKHSSVSMNFFQEPTPLIETEAFQDILPSSYPIPNWRESWSAATSQQSLRTLIALFHFLTSVIVFVAGNMMGEAAFSTLAHLVFYDSLGSFALAAVSILSNFDVWKKPSIEFPFGLGRLEVLIGYGLSTSLVMVGCDLVSHSIEESILKLVIENSGDSADHGSHHIHQSPDRVQSLMLYEATVALVVFMTGLTTVLLYGGEGQLSDMMSGSDDRESKSKPGAISYLDTSNNKNSLARARFMTSIDLLLKNPMRLITLSYSTMLLLLPLVPESVKDVFKVDVDEASTLIVASTLCYVGWKLVTTLGSTLLISFPYTEYDYSVLKSSIADQIMHLDTFKSSYMVHHIFITKVNYQLYIVGLKLSMKGGSADDESRMLFEVNRTLQGALLSFDKDSQVETTIEIDRI